MAVDAVQKHKLRFIFLPISPTCASWPSSLITWLTLKLNANLLRKSHYYANIIGNTFSTSSSNSQQNFFKARNSYLYKEVNTKVKKVRKVGKKYCMKTTINFGQRILVFKLYRWAIVRFPNSFNSTVYASWLWVWVDSAQSKELKEQNKEQNSDAPLGIGTVFAKVRFQILWLLISISLTSWLQAIRS